MLLCIDIVCGGPRDCEMDERNLICFEKDVNFGIEEEFVVILRFLKCAPMLMLKVRPF